MKDKLDSYAGTMHTYTAFGLSFASEILLPELVRAAVAEPDVTIRLGKVPDTFENIIIKKPNRSIGKDKFRLDTPGIAKFFVEKGNSILLEPYEGALAEEIKLYVLGSCMGAILFQRGILPLHGSCLNIEGQGVLLTGVSGAGKSTIAAALLQQGYGMLTDDVAAVTWLESGEPAVQPGYPSQKLWEDALVRMNHKAEIKSLNRIVNDMSKYSVVNNNSFYNQPVKLRRIYEVIPATTDALRFEEVTGTDKLGVVVNNTYRRFWVRGFDCREWRFHHCANIANRVSVCRISRPQGVHLEQKIAEKIIEQMSV